MEMQNGQINRKVRIKNASKIKTAIVIVITVILVGAFRYHFDYERRIASFVTKNEPELDSGCRGLSGKDGSKRKITYRGIKTVAFSRRARLSLLMSVVLELFRLPVIMDSTIPRRIFRYRTGKENLRKWKSSRAAFYQD